MQAVDIHNNLFAADNFEYVEINKNSQSTLDQKKISRGIQSALNLLNELENCFQKSNNYEDRLLKCRMTHDHPHDSHKWWYTDVSDANDSKTNGLKSPRNPFDQTGSWSTMSIVCLQYQYEELTKRYNTLLKAYNDRCSSLSSYDVELLKLHKNVEKAHVDINNMNKSILTIGNKYLTLKHKKAIQKVWYEDRIDRLKRAIRTILVTAENARLDFDE